MVRTPEELVAKLVELGKQKRLLEVELLKVIATHTDSSSMACAALTTTLLTITMITKLPKEEVMNNISKHYDRLEKAFGDKIKERQ